MTECTCAGPTPGWPQHEPGCGRDDDPTPGRHCCHAPTRCDNCCKEPTVKFHDGHNTGTVGADPWDGRVILEWSDDDVLQTRVSLSPDDAEAYANAVLAAVEEARR